MKFMKGAALSKAMVQAGTAPTTTRTRFSIGRCTTLLGRWV